MCDLPGPRMEPLSSVLTGGFFTDWASLDAKLVKTLPAKHETLFNSWVGQICWRRERLPTSVFLGFPDGSAGKESACSAGDLGSIPGLGRSPEEGKGYPLQYSGLENSMDCIIHEVTKSQIWLSDFHFHQRTPLNFSYKDWNDFSSVFWVAKRFR